MSHEPWLNHLFAILGLAALCVGWAFAQAWLRHADPHAPGVESGSGGGCGGGGHCGGGGCGGGPKRCSTRDEQTS